jgi:hypothetical protein
MIVDWKKVVMRLEKISVERLAYFYEMIILDLENLVLLVISIKKNILKFKLV